MNQKNRDDSGNIAAWRVQSDWLQIYRTNVLKVTLPPAHLRTVSLTKRNLQILPSLKSSIDIVLSEEININKIRLARFKLKFN